MKILVTGAAGFIGAKCCADLLAEGHEVIGLDNLNAYYDVSLKRARLDGLTDDGAFRFVRMGLEDQGQMADLFKTERFERVIHLGAQAGVRYSLTHPHTYAESNLEGMLNVLEGCRHAGVEHLVYASSSSVYGANTQMPFSVHHAVDHPVSLYAATKKANELMAHTYSHLYDLPTTGLRFFTVYGPWGRPDMAIFLFTKALLEGRPIEVYNYGQMKRDFTYIDDIAHGVLQVMYRPPKADDQWSGDRPDPGSSHAPYRLYNIGNNRPVALLDLIQILEEALDKKAIMAMKPMQPGDVPETFADIDDLVADVGFKPDTPLSVGIERFVQWYRDYYHV